MYLEVVRQATFPWWLSTLGTLFVAATLFLLLTAVYVLFVRERQAIHHPTTAQSRRSIGIGWRLTFQTRAGKARGFLRFWPIVEWFTRSIWHIQPIPDAPYHLLEVRFTNYAGKPIDLPDGTCITRGDPVIELHFRNQAFLEMGEHIETWKYMHVIAQDLKALAHWVQQPDFSGNALAIYGMTLLYRGAPRLGFTRQGTGV